MRNFLRRIRIFVLRDYRTILTAVAVSFVIWFVASLDFFPDIIGHVNGIKVKEEPTTYMINNNLQVVGGVPDELNVQIEGKRYIIDRLTSKDFDAQLDLSGVTQSGRQEVNIYVRPLDATKCSVKNDGVVRTTVDVIKIITKTLDLSVNTNSLKVADGMNIDTVNLKTTPPKITVTGEYNLISSITKAEVRPRSDSTLSVTEELKGEVSLYTKDGVKVTTPDIKTDNAIFSVTVPIYKQKTLPVDFAIINAPANFDMDGLRQKMMILPKELTITSPDNSIDNLDLINIGDISLNDLDYVSVMRGIKQPVVLADGYRNISGTEFCQITFKDVDDYVVNSFKLGGDNFTVMNPPANFNVKVLTKELEVKIVGPASFVQSMAANDISIFINFMGTEVTAGTKKMNVSYKINGNANVPAWLVGNPQADVEIKAVA